MLMVQQEMRDGGVSSPTFQTELIEIWGHIFLFSSGVLTLSIFLVYNFLLE